MYKQNVPINSISIANPFFRNFSYTNPICRIISKLLLPIGFDIGYCRYQSKITIYSKKKDELLYKNSPKGYFINLGAGGFRHRYWINYDYEGQTKYYKRLLGRVNVDYKLIDLNSNLKSISEEKIAACYLSHTLEHLPIESGINVLNFVYERLSPGGVIRVAVPDHEILFLSNKINKSICKEEEILCSMIHIAEQVKFEDRKELINIFHNSESCDELYQNMISKWPHICKPVKGHPEYHLSLWSRQLIKKITKNNFFDQIYITSRNQSKHKAFTNSAIFDTTEAHNSLYFEICKNV